MKRYPIHDKAHADNAASRFAQNKQRYTAEQQKLIMGRIHAAQQKFGEKPDEDSGDHKMMGRSSESPLVEIRTIGKVDNVDFGQRLITVLTVPYEETAEVVYRQEVWNEVFSRTAFDGIEAYNRRIPVNREHRSEFYCGKVIQAFPHRDDGLVTEIRVSRTDLGDETLRMAADDDLAASPGFIIKDSYRDQELDRRSKTRRIKRASLDHVALTGAPAYAGTKVLAMRNSEDSLEAHLPILDTPNLDRYADDPIFQWAAERLQ